MERDFEEKSRQLLLNLNKLRDNLAYHIRVDHQGVVVPVSCHRCMVKKSAIILAEENFEKFSQKHLAESKNEP